MRSNKILSTVIYTWQQPFAHVDNVNTEVKLTLEELKKLYFNIPNVNAADDDDDDDSVSSNSEEGGSARDA